MTSRPFMLLPRLVSALRRRRRMCAALGAVGLLGAVLISLAFPPRYSATTLVLVRHPEFSGLAPGEAIETDAQLVTSRPTAERAITRLRAPLSTIELLSASDATPVTNNVLRISVRGATEEEAVRRADAVAAAFLAFRRELRIQQSEAEADVLKERQQELRRELQGVVDELNRAPAAEGRGKLLAQQSDLTEKVAQLGRRAEEAQLRARTAAGGSRVIDPARLDERSPIRALLANMAAGAVAGTALGAGLIVVQEVSSDRLRRREDITAALGVPVAVSVGAFRGPVSVQRRRLREQQVDPRPEITRVVRHLRDLLSKSEEAYPALVVVSLESDGVAALVLGSAALELVQEERHVLLADLSAHATLAELFGAPPGEESIVPWPDTGSRLAMTVPTLENLDPQALRPVPTSLRSDGEAGAVLTMATLDPAVGASHVTPWGSRAVVVVTAGRSTPTALRAVAQMLQAAGVELCSAILVGASPDDESVGVREGTDAELPVRHSWATR